MKIFRKWQKIVVIVAAVLGVVMIVGGASSIKDDKSMGVFGIVFGLISLAVAVGLFVIFSRAKSTEPEKIPTPQHVVVESPRVKPESEAQKQTSPAFSQKVEYHKVDQKFMREMYNDAVRRNDQAGALYYAAEMDLTFVRKKDEYYAHQEEINSDYSVIYNLSAWGTPAAKAFEEKCLYQMNDAEYLARKYAEYQIEQPKVCEAYKKLAQVYEKQGRYDDAANVCARAIVAGYPNDGTNAGMRGRLARMIRLGGKLSPKYAEISDSIEV